MSLFFQTHFQDGATSSGGGGCPTITLGDFSGDQPVVGNDPDFAGGQVTGGSGPMTFNVTGTLPTGTSLEYYTESGLNFWILTGTYSAAGSFTFTVSGTDNNGCSITPKEYTIGVCPVITLGDNWTNGMVGQAFNPTAQSVSGTDGPHTIQVLSGSIPAGLTIDTESYEETPGNWVFEMYGNPTTFGSYTFTIGGTDVNGCPITPKEYTIEVWAQFTYSTPLSINSGSNIFSIPVSGLPAVYGTGVKLDHAELNITKSDNTNITALLLYPASGYFTYYSIYAGITTQLTGSDITSCNAYDSGYPIITTGSAPYSGNFIGEDDAYTFSSAWDGAVVNDSWVLQLDSFDTQGSINSVTLTFKPI